MRHASAWMAGAFAAAAAGALALSPVTHSSAAPTPDGRLAQASPAAMPVDAELILAVDISYSMDPDEQALQREGYIQAITSQEFLQAIREGAHARVAITYFEWAGSADQRVVVPWRLIDGPEAAAAVAAELQRAPYRRASRTSISGALGFALPLFGSGGYRGLRRVIDVSGDGANNNGIPVTVARDQVLAKGVTINGLPIMLKKASFAGIDIDNLDVYYEDCVMGGPGAFVLPIREREKFTEAIRTKLVQEVAGRTPAARLVPASAEAPRISCTIGEELWNHRWGGFDR